MLAYGVGLIFEREGEAGTDQGASYNEFVIGSLKLANVLETMQQSCLQFDVVVEQIEGVCCAQISGDHTINFSRDNLARRLKSGSLMVSVFSLPLHNRMPISNMFR